jgi:hypothetical protein
MPWWSRGSIIDSGVLTTTSVLAPGRGEDGCGFARQRAVEPEAAAPIEKMLERRSP